MGVLYGVVWREPGCAAGRGKLELLPESLRLVGIADAAPTQREIRYDALAGVHVGRDAGRQCVVLELPDREPLTIATVAQTGVAAEIVARVAERRALAA